MFKLSPRVFFPRFYFGNRGSRFHRRDPWRFSAQPAIFSHIERLEERLLLTFDPVFDPDYSSELRFPWLFNSYDVAKELNEIPPDARYIKIFNENMTRLP